MKKLLSLLAVALIFAACDKKPDQPPVDNRTLTLSANKTTITADGTDAVTFTVKLGDENVTATARLKMNGTDFTGSTFTTTESGTYKFIAVHGEKTSNELSVTVTEVVEPTPILSVNKNAIMANGEDAVTFTVKLADKDVTSTVTIFEGEIELEGNTFTTTNPGTYK